MIIRPEDHTIHEPDKELLKIINNKKFNDKVLYKKKSDFHDIKVVENEVGRFLHYKNTYQAGFVDTPSYKGNLPYINYFTIPYLINKDVENILLIGFGTGKIVSDFEILFDNLKSIDVVDIEENIFEIANEFFGYRQSDKVDFHLQDGLVYLRNCKKKYDLIVVDVASDEGIDERFLEDDYLKLINKCLSKTGMFVSNLCASPDFEHSENELFQRINGLYKRNFKHNLIFKGNTSDRIYYESFFGLKSTLSSRSGLDPTRICCWVKTQPTNPQGLNENIDFTDRVIDITNVILISSQSPMSIGPLTLDDKTKYKKIGLEIEEYLEDLL